jgi:glycosyltransferase involved in cell wall biosynthesis
VTIPCSEATDVKLAVIGDTQHYRDELGRLCALEPVVNQLDRWAELFDEVVLCAPLDPGPPPAGFAPYGASNLRIEPLRKAGGNTLLAKLGLLPRLVPWAVSTRRVARQVDAVHLRCPCNIGMVAIFSTWRAVRYRYALYAGVWHSYQGEPRFFAAQRRLLGSRRFGGPVSVYAAPDPSHPHLVPFFSPSYSDDDWVAAAPGAEATLVRIEDPATEGPWRLVTVGRLTVNKNQETAVRAVGELVRRGRDVRLGIFGDGPERARLEALAAEVGAGEQIEFHGSVGHPDVMAAFADADVNLLTTRQEGYGKVLLEGMVHGVVPVFSRSPVADEIAGGGERGVVVDADDWRGLADQVERLLDDRDRWAGMARAARAFAGTVTLENFQQRVRQMLESQWGVSMPDPDAVAP